MKKYFLFGIMFLSTACNKTYTYETANEDVKGAYNLQELVFISSCVQSAINSGGTRIMSTTYCRCCADILKSKFDFSPFRTQNILDESNNRAIGAMLSPDEINTCVVRIASQVKTTVSM
jgi:hypothetical protein